MTGRKAISAEPAKAGWRRAVDDERFGA